MASAESQKDVMQYIYQKYGRSRAAIVAPLRNSITKALFVTSEKRWTIGGYHQSPLPVDLGFFGRRFGPQSVS